MSVSFLIKLQASGEFCEISKSTFFTEHLWVTASIRGRKQHKRKLETQTSLKFTERIRRILVIFPFTLFHENQEN